MNQAPRKRRPLRLALAAALSLSSVAHAVWLNPDGLGQALVYPYYTVRSSEGSNAFNTYLSVVNHTADAKAVRVRVREGRAGREVASFNLYLSPNDAWTGAIAPTAAGASLVTADASCTDPAFAGTGLASLDFTSASYTGNNSDGFGDTLDRAREGYVEMIEMAALSGASAAAVTHNSAGVPANCAAMGAMASPGLAPPTGGLSGTLTLINVASGLDFTLSAEALADLSTRTFFRAASDPYPDFAAAEIDPVSVVVANGQLYRSAWNRGVDAVSAALMRSSWHGEYVLDPGTASLTDFVLTQPTRHHYATAKAFQPPYTGRAIYGCVEPMTGARGGEVVNTTVHNREERGTRIEGCPTLCPPFGGDPRICAATAIGAIRSTAPHVPLDTTRSPVLGSSTMGLYMSGNLLVTTGFSNGWIGSVLPPDNTLVSLASSTRTDLSTGAVTSGALTHAGLPVTGFAVRTFRNGTLSCSGGACQGNYGGAFPFKYTRQVTP